MYRTYYNVQSEVARMRLEFEFMVKYSEHDCFTDAILVDVYSCNCVITFFPLGDIISGNLQPGTPLIKSCRKRNMVNHSGADVLKINSFTASTLTFLKFGLVLSPRRAPGQLTSSTHMPSVGFCPISNLVFSALAKHFCLPGILIARDWPHTRLFGCEMLMSRSEACTSMQIRQQLCFLLPVHW